MYFIFQTPSYQKALNITLYIYLQNCTSHDGKLAETTKLFLALASLVFGHISNDIWLNT